MPAQQTPVAGISACFLINIAVKHDADQQKSEIPYSKIRAALTGGPLNDAAGREFYM